MSVPIITTISFPEIRLNTRDAHKLRGYFGNLFKAHSPLLHNHYEDGTLRYKYPLVQYKVVDNTPLLLGFNEGAKLLTELFLQISELKINDSSYPIYSKNIIQKNMAVGLDDELHVYEFKTLWMGLNQKNYQEFKNYKEESEKLLLLKKILQGNLLGFFKGIGIWLNGKLMVTISLKQKKSQFKDQKMIAFSGTFTTNAIIPDYTGLGKAVSRGFGTIKGI